MPGARSPSATRRTSSQKRRIDHQQPARVVEHEQALQHVVRAPSRSAARLGLQQRACDRVARAPRRAPVPPWPPAAAHGCADGGPRAARSAAMTSSRKPDHRPRRGPRCARPEDESDGVADGDEQRVVRDGVRRQPADRGRRSRWSAWQRRDRAAPSMRRKFVGTAERLADLGDPHADSGRAASSPSLPIESEGRRRRPMQVFAEDLLEIAARDRS